MMSLTKYIKDKNTKVLLLAGIVNLAILFLTNAMMFELDTTLAFLVYLFLASKIISIFMKQTNSITYALVAAGLLAIYNMVLPDIIGLWSKSMDLIPVIQFALVTFIISKANGVK